nr:MAG TPA: hypothetical protein [Caudoviricetes sp.]
MLTCIAYLSISLAKYFSTGIPALSRASLQQLIPSNRERTVIGCIIIINIKSKEYRYCTYKQ